jgi:hypothetical protein
MITMLDKCATCPAHGACQATLDDIIVGYGTRVAHSCGHVKPIRVHGLPC